MIFSHLRWIPTPSPIFSSNLEELRGPSFTTLGATAPSPPCPLAGATDFYRSLPQCDTKIDFRLYLASHVTTQVPAHMCSG